MKRKTIWLASSIVLLLAVAAAIGWLLTAEAGLRWTYARVQSLVPGALEVDVLEGRLAGPIVVRGLHYRDESLDARVDQVTFDWSPLALLRGRLRVTELSVHSTRLQLAPNNTSKTSASHKAPKLPLRIQVEHFAADEISIDRSGQSPYKIASIQLAARADPNMLYVDRLDIDAPTLRMSARGELGLGRGSGTMTFDFRADPATLGPVAARGQIVGNLSAFTFALETSEPLTSTLHGGVDDALAHLRWRAEWDVPTFDIERVRANLSGKFAMHAMADGDLERFSARGGLRTQYADFPEVIGDYRLHGATAGDIVLDELALRVPNTDMTAAVSGDWRNAKQNIRAKLRWQNLRWPLSGEASVSTPSGEVAVDGTPSAYQFTLAMETRGEKLPAATLQATGRGNLSHVASESLALQTLETNLHGAAEMTWKPRIEWTAHLQGNGLNPGVVWSDWPGRLDIDLRATGKGNEIRADLVSLKGTLREHAVNAQAAVVRRGEEYPRLALTARSGDATLRVDGSLLKQWNVDWQVAAPNLGAVLPHATGRLRAAGNIRGAIRAPTISGTADGAAIDVEGWRAGQLAIDVSVDLSDRQQSRARLNFVDAVLAGRKLERISANADGRVSDHTIELHLNAAETALQLRFAGGYTGGEWRGRVADGNWTIAEEKWTLAQSASWVVGTKRIAIDETCWHAGDARLCARFDRAADHDMRVQLTATHAPLGIFAPALASTLRIRGAFDGSAELRLQSGQLRQIDGRFVAAPGRVRLSDASIRTTLSYQSAVIEIKTEERGLRARAEFLLPNGDRGEANVRLPHFQPAAPAGANQPVEGALTLAVRDLSPFAALFPQIGQLRGNLDANLSLRGTLVDPDVRGTVQLAEGAADIAALGIQVHDVRITAVPEKNALRLSGSAISNNGQIGIGGRVVFGTSPAWRAELVVAGADFQAAKLPRADVSVTPDLRIQISDHSIKITGNVRVPHAQITMKQQKRGVEPSPDVVIEGTTAETSATPPAWDVSADINLTLGDDVNFDGFGMTGQIKGSVELMENSTRVTTARGELSVVNGRYLAYGQRLDIERGRLLFAGGPIEEPNVDARATRKIEQITVGVEVRGTLKSPTLTLFSDPAMSQTDTLSYLLFGKSSDTSNPGQGATLAAATRALKMSGGEYAAQRIGERLGIEEVDVESNANSQASLVLGKRLSPNLYINYSIGLIEPVSVFRIRYQLAANWVLQAESGLNKGADLLYTLER